MNFAYCNYFLDSNSPDILAIVKQTWIIQFIWAIWGYLLLILKYSFTHMHGLAVYVKEELPFARDLSPENSADSYLCFLLALLHLVSYFFFLYCLPSLSLSMVFDVFHL